MLPENTCNSEYGYSAVIHSGFFSRFKVEPRGVTETRDRRCTTDFGPHPISRCKDYMYLFRSILLEKMTTVVMLLRSLTVDIIHFFFRRTGGVHVNPSRRSIAARAHSQGGALCRRPDATCDNFRLSRHRAVAAAAPGQVAPPGRALVSTVDSAAAGRTNGAARSGRSKSACLPFRVNFAG
jgi:hypothetical protein